MAKEEKISVVFVGAGPASLAGAIKIKQLLKANGREESVVIIEKADKLGQHNLSGAVFEAEVLDELMPDWRSSKHAFVTKMLNNRVEVEKTVLLRSSRLAIDIPNCLVPSYMRHAGNYTISVSEMVRWLGEVARGLGVEIYTGFAVKDALIEDGTVKGVVLGEKGLDSDGNQQSNYLPAEKVYADITVFGEGSLGQVTDKIIRNFELDKGRNKQVYSVGVKEVLRLPEGSNSDAFDVIHTIGYPLPADVFGGGVLYNMGSSMVAVALIMSLDWRYCDLNPQKELQIFKAHKYINRLIEGAEVVAYGAKTIPEGGYYAMPKPFTDGALLVGDAAGLTDVRKQKGLHNAIKSGMLAAEAAFAAIKEGDYSEKTLQKYEHLLNNSSVIKDLYKARNYRQIFNSAGRLGIHAGAPLSLVQHWIPFRLKTNKDHHNLEKSCLNRKHGAELDRLTGVSLSGTDHREDAPPHVKITDSLKCKLCLEKFGCQPCNYFCPGEGYKTEGEKILLSPSNCLHCQTCRVKCPFQVIKWELPEGGSGPKYKLT